MSGRVSTKSHKRSQRPCCIAPSQQRHGARQGKPTDSVKQLYDLPGTFTSKKYMQLHTEALLERLMKGSGKSIKMNHLFRLWCFKLRDEFDTSAYLDFFRLAQEDNHAGYTYGMECLFRFFSYGLERDFRQELYKDFERVVLEQFHAGGLYGLEKFWAFHAFKGFPPGSSVQMHPELAELISTRFTKLEDFKPGNSCSSPARGSCPTVLSSSLQRDLVLPDSLDSPGRASLDLSGTSPSVAQGHAGLKSSIACSVPCSVPCGGQSDMRRSKWGRQTRGAPALQSKPGGKAGQSTNHPRPARHGSSSQDVGASSSRSASTKSAAPRVPESPPGWISSSWKERLNWQAPEYIPASLALDAEHSSVPLGTPASRETVNKALAAAAALVQSLPTVSRRKKHGISGLLHAPASTALSTRPDTNSAQSVPHRRLDTRSQLTADSAMASYTSDATILNGSTCIASTGDVLQSILGAKFDSSIVAASSADAGSVDGGSSACELEHSLIFCMDLDSDGDAPVAHKAPEASAGVPGTSSCSPASSNTTPKASQS